MGGKVTGITTKLVRARERVKSWCVYVGGVKVRTRLKQREGKLGGGRAL